MIMNELSFIGEQPARILLVHGVIILCIGVLSGIPFWFAIILNRAKHTVNAWRVAHSTLIASGLLMVVASLISPQLALSRELGSLMVRSFIVSGYGFAFALVVGAWIGRRGLIPWPLGLNTVLFAGHFIGATGSFIGLVILIYGLFGAL